MLWLVVLCVGMMMGFWWLWVMKIGRLVLVGVCLVVVVVVSGR